MTEKEWLGCDDRDPMLSFMNGKISERKMRYFMIARFRSLWARRSFRAGGLIAPTYYYDARDEANERQLQSELLRHILGNPFRPTIRPDWWPTDVLRIAEALYSGEECAFALHDALLDAGHIELAEHFREPDHPKGCWALDLILGKS